MKKWAIFKLPAILLGFTVLTMHQAVWATGDDSIADLPSVSFLAGSSAFGHSSLPLAVGNAVDQKFQPKSETDKKIKNIITLRVWEETPDFIPDSFSAAVNVRINYGDDETSAANTYIDRVLTVTYTKAEGAKYNARQSFSFDGAKYVKITVLDVFAPMRGSYNTINALVLENEMRVTRYYTLKNNVSPDTFTSNEPAAGDDELSVAWTWPPDAGNTHTQLEWTWVENEFVPTNNDYDLLFRNNSTRVDLSVGTTSYKIPLLYGGEGRLYFRIRAVNISKTGSRTDGPWAMSSQVYRTFVGHNDSLNWQSTITFAEDGKRKALIQYYDGSLRSRQTVTKDNVTNTVIAAETIYDGEGRAAIQILPAPIAGNAISYTKGLNLFKENIQLNTPDQTLSDDPVRFFDMQPLATATSITPALLSDNGAGRYFSGDNPEKNNGVNAHIPNAEGYPYAVTRYTPDATGRVMAQSTAGAAMQMGKGHETKYYYGTPAQEELDALFGTEVGNYTHYFKNMSIDANGQAAVSYVDMHGRTIATALAGAAPGNLVSLNRNNIDYPGQTIDPSITRNLLDINSNIVKNGSIESVNSLLVPYNTSYSFNYKLTPQSLQLTSCTNTTVCYDCLYDLEISITDESGDKKPIVRRYKNVSLRPGDDCSFGSTPSIQKDIYINVTDSSQDAIVNNNEIQFAESLNVGSYSVRKTLTISESSLQVYKDLYLTKGLCVNGVASTSLDDFQQDLIDSVYNKLRISPDCGNLPPANTCSACYTDLDTYANYKAKYLLSINNPTVTPELEAEILASYNAGKASCDKLCNTTSQSLPTKRQLMLADMIPYSGQYAKAARTGTMYDKYNIFSTVYPSTQPFYKISPPDRAAQVYYKTPLNVIDAYIHPGNSYTKLDGMSADDFAEQFANSWAETLLKYHPEYNKLVFAETNLVTSYNWITTFNNTTTWAEAEAASYIFTSGSTLNDPFYSVGTGYKSDMVTKLTGNYKNNLSLWQYAYGDAMCKTIIDPAQRNYCYQTAPATPPYNNLTTAQKDKVWGTFKKLYSMERDVHVNAHITASVPLSDAQPLVDEGYLLHFPTSNSQLAQQYGNNQQSNPDIAENYWAWYPANSGDAPNVNVIPGGATPAQTYESRCNSYVTQWVKAFTQCPALLGRSDSAQIVNQVMPVWLTFAKEVVMKGILLVHPMYHLRYPEHRAVLKK